MILFLTLCYIAVLAILIKLSVLRLTTFVKISPVIVVLLLNVGIFLPMQFAAPMGPAIVLKNTIQIVPNVAGRVTEVAVEAYTPINEGDLLFSIDDRPYRAAVANIKAQLTLAERRVAQADELQRNRAGSIYELEAAETQVESLKAQLDGAEFNLENTQVLAPATGHVTNLALREGAMVAAFPLAQAMAFVDDSTTGIVVSIHQINLRYIEPGQKAEVVLKAHPGQVFPATVEYVIADLATGQFMPGGSLPVPGQIFPAPYYVRLILDDAELARSLPTGAAGVAAIYTGEFEISYMIRRAMMWMDAWLAYFFPV
jgi:multidrug resistance efflux pump